MAHIQPKTPTAPIATAPLHAKPDQSVFDILAELAHNQHVSDLHLAEGSDCVWARRNGYLEPAVSGIAPAAMSAGIDRILGQGTGATNAETRLHQAGDADIALVIGKTRFRANVYRSNGKRSAALRAFKSEPPLLDSLGLPGAWWDMLKRSSGLLLVTGATGSGKSTTLASSLMHVSTLRRGHIITLEDPIEYELKSTTSLIDQRQLGADFSDYRQGLRSALRQDPDVILVGELRDRETVQTALDAANTGHLVMGTLHTNNARLAVERLVSFFPGDDRDWVQMALSQVLVGVLSQFLLPGRPGKSRSLATELMVGTSSIKSAIKDGKSNTLFSIMDTGSKEGHQLLNHCLVGLVRSGAVERNDAIFTSYDHAGLTRDLGNA